MVLLLCTTIVSPFLKSSSMFVERKHQQQQQQTQTQLSEHKANVRNNKVNGSTTTDAEAALVVAKRPDSGDQEGSIDHYDVEISQNPSKEIAQMIKTKSRGD
ncbi:BnaA07g00490D [Brassica napus]|uniref:BnaA07g00490D protein n=1 Tax=Brassica napus TaxID=3708 RepID=A0A078H2B9_BRANA|nr:BnaA07g00490D [Brassica napus]